MKFIYKNTKPKDKIFGLIALVEKGDTEVLRKSNGQKEITLNVGKTSEITLRKLNKFARQIIQLSAKNKIKKLALIDKDIKLLNRGAGLGDLELGELLAREMSVSAYEFRMYKTVPKEGWNDVGEVALVGKFSKEFKQGLDKGTLIALEINAVRDLANQSASEITPESLGKRAVLAAKGTKVKVKVLVKKELEKLGMGALLGVGKGSNFPPVLIVMEYLEGSKDEAPIVLVGKGITFDSGGINLKPSVGGSLTEMNMDMSGGATTIHAIVAVAKLGIKKNVIALIPSAENMVDGASYRPGDVLRSMSGKSIEILNTDAEGRLVLADALTYAERYNPRLVVDVATLTGAAMVALGTWANVIMTADEKLMMNVMRWGEQVSNLAWPLPVWEELEREIKGTIGDVQNLGKSGKGGTITAGMFLREFTKKYPKDCKWLHIDMAPRMISAEGDELAKGSTGEPTALLVKIVEEF